MFVSVCLSIKNGIVSTLVRMEHTIDMSTAIKFIYVHWVGTNVPFAKRGRFGVVSGSVKNLFNVSKCAQYTCKVVSPYTIL